MTVKSDISPIISTKLHRPPIHADIIYRGRLIESLEKSVTYPLILVSAPAGYGKSTLVASWLDRCDSPSAWVSLDETDSDLRLFLIYFLFAVHSLFPGAANKTESMINAPNLPSLSTLTGSLVNELDAIEQDFILVMDDIHFIREKAVLDFLDALLLHPPHAMHLVLICRRDPFVTITTLRARGHVFELRLQDLRFTEAETGAYLQQLFETPVDPESAAAWTEKTEGWVTGLRLAALSMKHRGDYRSLLPELHGGTQYIMEYLFNEILSHQPVEVRDYLLKISILDRFCAPLCTSLCKTGDESHEETMDCWDFLGLLKRENLFLISLDSEGRWYRFHHLFQHLLRRQLDRYRSPDEIAELHSQASRWFESQGLITESIRHAMAAGDSVRAAEIVEGHRVAKQEMDQWYDLPRWMAMLPVEIKDQRQLLLLIQAWICYERSQVEELVSILERLEKLLDGEAGRDTVFGELCFFKGYFAYFTGQADESRKWLEKAVAMAHGRLGLIQGEMELMLGAARQMCGQQEKAIRALNRSLSKADLSDDLYIARLIAGLAFIFLLSGELSRAEEAAMRLESLASKKSLTYTHAWSHYMLALSHFHSHDLTNALAAFESAADKRYLGHTRVSVDALAGLAITYQFMGRPEDARKTMGLLESFARETNDQNCLAVVLSSQARLGLLQGDLTSAARWVRTFKEMSDTSTLFFWLEVPSITQAKVLIAIGTDESLGKATELLKMLRQMAETWQHTCQTIEIAILQSVALDKLGMADEALAALDEAVALAGPLGWIRPFVEAGPAMADLLNRLQEQNASLNTVNKILAAFPDTESKPSLANLGASEDPHKLEAEIIAPIQSVKAMSDKNRKSKIQNSLIEPLTNRELDVLELLAERLQNKEIADKLCISHRTVNPT